MRVEWLDRKLSAQEAGTLIGAAVPQQEPDDLGECLLRDAEDDSPILAYLPLDRVWVAALRQVILPLEGGSMGRGRVTANSRSFGYMPRRPVYGREGCQASSLALESREAEQLLDDLASHLQGIFERLVPERIKADLDATAAIDPSWRLGESLYTSGVINRSATLPYHRDVFNFPVISAMPVVRRGMAGGHLHIPEYGLTVACRDGWCLFFPGQQLVHGVTPMRQTQPDGYRFSVVYYALRGMKDCYTAAVETIEARRKRTARERSMAARLRDGEPIDGPDNGLPRVSRTGGRFIGGEGISNKGPEPFRGLPPKQGGRMIGGKSGRAFDPEPYRD